MVPLASDWPGGIRPYADSRAESQGSPERGEAVSVRPSHACTHRAICHACTDRAEEVSDPAWTGQGRLHSEEVSSGVVKVEKQGEGKAGQSLGREVLVGL